MDYTNYFFNLTQHSPYPWQIAYQDRDTKVMTVVKIPTGLGKTEAILVDWLFDRAFNPDKTPRRLVVQLPLRTLVDQWSEIAKKLVNRSGLPILVNRLQGGQIEEDYALDLAQPAVIIGTVDQIISRRLNRGYCCPRTLWPVTAAALNQDLRLIVDESQLQAVGSQTSIRLFELSAKKRQLPCELVIASATVTQPIDCPIQEIQLTEADFRCPGARSKLERSKPFELRESSVEPLDVAVIAAKRFLDQPGLTLVVCNTVRRAQEVYQALPAELPKRLLHSRFRPQERVLDSEWQGILVATQVIEAGIDLDAAHLITDLCPWPSLVQRLGRVGRSGTYPYCTVEIFVPSRPLPYTSAELESSKQALGKLTDLGIKDLALITVPQQRLTGPVLGSSDLNQFFSTHPKVTGDYSPAPFIRDNTDQDCFVLWRDQEPEPDSAAPHPQELCRVPLNALKRLVKSCFRFDKISEQWAQISASQAEIGDQILLLCDQGGYSPILGWTGVSEDQPEPIEVSTISIYEKSKKLFYAGYPVTLTQHLAETEQEARQIVKDLRISAGEAEAIVRAALLHDWGKAHPIFQETLSRSGCPSSGDLWAKSPGSGRHSRPGFRHELASALAALETQEPFLIAYLLVAHHGKLRTQLDRYHWQPESQYQHGIDCNELDSLPSFTLSSGEVLPAVKLIFPTKKIGQGWTAKTAKLLSQHGYFDLLLWEAIVRQADRQASAIHQPTISQHSGWGCPPIRDADT